jgi:hypothetical protein
MKPIVIILFAAESAWQESSQDSSTIEGIYLGIESEIYKFSDKDDFIYEFKAIEGEALKKYDLSDKTLIDKSFYVTYRTKIEADESEEESIEYEVHIITDLEFVED